MKKNITALTRFLSASDVKVQLFSMKNYCCKKNSFLDEFVWSWIRGSRHTCRHALLAPEKTRSSRRSRYPTPRSERDKIERFARLHQQRQDQRQQQQQHLHQYTATKSFSLRSRSSCLAVTSSITGSASFCLPAEPRDEADSSAFVLAAASTWPRRIDTNASTVRRMIVVPG